VENVKARHGGFYASLERVTPAEQQRLESHLMTEQVGSTIYLGSARLTAELQNFVHAPDEVWLDLQGYQLAEGSYPSAPGEIALERWIFSAARRPVSIGDKLTLTIRADAGDGAAGDGATASASESTPSVVEQTFTVVGFLTPNSAGVSRGVAEAIVSVSQARAMRGEDVPSLTGFTTTEDYPPQEALAEVARSIGRGTAELSRNTALLAAMGESGMDQANDALRAVEVIVAGILLVATIAVIYNSFAISVTERIRQFGIIRTVGATPMQIRRLVYRQAAVVAGIGAPIGLGAGLLAVRIVVAIFNGLGLDIGFAGVAMSYPPAILIGGPLLGVAAVFISAIVPARLAARVSPLEAVLAEGRFVKDRIRSRRSPLLGRVFGISGRLATQNLRRHRGRFLVTVFSIGVGVALFITFSGFFNILSTTFTTISGDVGETDVNVYTRQNGSGETEPLSVRERTLIEELPGVDGVIGLHEVPAYLAFPAEGYEGVQDTVDAKVADRVREATGESGPVASFSILGLDEEGLSRVRRNLTREESRLSGVYVPEGYYDVGETMNVMIDGEAVALPVAGLASTLPVGNDNADTAVTSPELARELSGAGGYTGFRVHLSRDAVAADAVRAIQALTGDRSDVVVVDLSEMQAAQEGIRLQFSILLYGLVAVVSLIGALNIVNTITTNLIIRIREFGTLRAVGMSGVQMRAMVRIEAVLYGIWAWVGGAAVGVLLTRLMFNNVNSLQAIPWNFPWLSIFAAIAAVLIITMVSAAAPMKRIGAMNIVESIRMTE
jgi:putative ABC transport system permease protein